MRALVLLTFLVALPAAAAQGGPKTTAPGAVASHSLEGAAKLNDPGSSTGEEYEKRILWFEDYVGINQRGTVVASWTQPFQGKYKKPLGWSEFYSLVERPDLALSYSTWMATKYSLMFGGFAATIGGVLLPLLWTSGGEEYCGKVGSNGSCRYYSYTEKTRPGLIPGIAIGSVGLVATIWSLFINPQPIMPSEARELADEHNKKLKRELGATHDSGSSPGHVRSKAPKVALGLAPLSGGGMLAIGGTF
jgi:hypothetical protein